MKTTLQIDDEIMTCLKQEAARRGQTMSQLVEIALRRLLAGEPATADLPPLPVFDGGGTAVDVADRDELYRVMEGR